MSGGIPLNRPLNLAFIVKSTNTYAAETWCLKAKTVAKLNSTEMDFCGDARLEFPGRTKLGIILLNKK